MELTSEILQEAKRLIGGGFQCKFAELMKENGFDPENGDLMVFPKAFEKEIDRLGLSHLVPEYVRFSDWIDKGYFIRNPYPITEIKVKEELIREGIRLWD